MPSVSKLSFTFWSIVTPSPIMLFSTVQPLPTVAPDQSMEFLTTAPDFKWQLFPNTAWGPICASCAILHPFQLNRLHRQIPLGVSG
ncbi:MAG: hypothetical protein CM1200mP16_12530 [Nitrospina sp.]|nr:MAG: hypothetical protein CM1200mP16_12530 [Nitrospina sp.]